MIGDYLYELCFRVEENIDGNNPEPMDMDFGPEGNGEVMRVVISLRRTMHHLVVPMARKRRRMGHNKVTPRELYQNKTLLHV